MNEESARIIRRALASIERDEKLWHVLYLIGLAFLASLVVLGLVQQWSLKKTIACVVLAIPGYYAVRITRQTRDHCRQIIRQMRERL